LPHLEHTGVSTEQSGMTPPQTIIVSSYFINIYLLIYFINICVWSNFGSDTPNR